MARADLLAQLGAFGGGAEGDVDGDGQTNVVDILALLAAFGSTCDVRNAIVNQQLSINQPQRTSHLSFDPS
eukprot:SAG31_NODE_243_length_19342_cov_12.906459_25_plen_71_part_00